MEWISGTSRPIREKRVLPNRPILRESESGGQQLELVSIPIHVALGAIPIHGDDEGTFQQEHRARMTFLRRELEEWARMAISLNGDGVRVDLP